MDERFAFQLLNKDAIDFMACAGCESSFQGWDWEITDVGILCVECHVLYNSQPWGTA